MTSEATGSLRGHFQRNSHSSGRNSRLRIAPSFLLHSIVVKASDFGARGPGFESRVRQSFLLLLNTSKSDKNVETRKINKSADAISSFIKKEKTLAIKSMRD